MIPSNRAVAAKSRNKDACEACRKRRQKCDRRPETRRKCSFCSMRNVECVRNDQVKGVEVSEGQLRFVEYKPEWKTDGLQSFDIASPHAQGLPSAAAAMSTQHDDTVDSLPCEMDFCFSPTETLFQPGDFEEITSSGDSKLLYETPSEVQLHLCDGDVITEHEPLQLRTEGAAQGNCEFTEDEKLFIPHLGHVFWIATGPDGRALVWYSRGDYDFVVICEGDFEVVEGPFCYSDVSL